MEQGVLLSLAAVVGLLLHLSIQQAWIGRFGTRDPRYALWGGFILFVGTCFVAARFFAGFVEDAWLQLVAARARLACMHLVVVGVAAAALGRRLTPRRQRQIVALCVLMGLVAVAVVLTPWFVAGTPPRLFLLQGAVVGGPLFWADVALVYAAMCLSLVRLRRLLEDDRSEVAAFRTVVWPVGLAAIHDSFLSAGWISGVGLLDYAMLLVALGANAITVKRYGVVFETLETAVADRTRQLAEQQGELLSMLEALSQSETRFRQMSQAAFEGVVVHENGKVLDANRSAESLFERDRHLLLGQEVLSLFSGSSRAVVEQVLEAGAELPVEATTVTPSGGERAVELMGRQLSQGDKNVGVLALRDVAERKAMVNQLIVAERMASLGTLAAGAAHEINNPLTFVMANLGFALEDLREVSQATQHRRLEDARDSIGVALEGTERIRQVVQDLKKLSLPSTEENGGLVLSEVVESSLKLAENELRHRAKVVRDFEDVPEIQGNAARLGQVLLNLFINAAQAIPVGNAEGNELRVRLRRQGDAHVLVEVSDTGKGIAPEDLHRIFDPFFSTKPVGQGTGLGLSVCHQLVTAMGGTIAVESQPGQGTTVRMVLRRGVSRPRRMSVAPAQIPPTRRPRLRVLIVDDEPLVARSLKRMLSHYSVVVVGNGRDALTLCQDEPFDVILCDLMMPEFSGMDLYESVKGTLPELLDRFFVMTGGAFSTEAKEFLQQLDESRVLTKPVREKDLERLLARFEPASKTLSTRSQ